jgi:predicted ABC-type exoprotein transport system permease subunit
MMMHDWMVYAPLHWATFILVVALVAYPVGRILKRMGFSPLWAILAFLPLLNLLGLWILALNDWPRQPDNE